MKCFLKEKHFTETVNGVSFTIRYIPGGTYHMGNVMGDKDAEDDEVVHKVTAADFYLAETAVTQELYEAVMGQNPSHFKGKDLPVETVSWDDAQAFIQKLNSLTGKKYRLPTEAEWEYAARGNQLSTYAGNDQIDSVAWYEKNSDDKTHPVKGKRPNALGLYDMTGNVEEWCQDIYTSYLSYENDITDVTHSFRILRGGSWEDSPDRCRNSNRNCMRHYNSVHSVGFRIALTTMM